MTRPVFTETLGYLRLPSWIWTRQVMVGGHTVSIALLIAKTLNCDDGGARPYHEWTARSAQLDEDLLAASPSA